MRFSPNLTVVQRAQDKRLGQIKHQMCQLPGYSLENVKIFWKNNIVKAGSEFVYKLTSQGTHEYKGKGLEIKEAVESFVHTWLEERGCEESD